MKKIKRMKTISISGEILISSTSSLAEGAFLFFPMRLQFLLAIYRCSTVVIPTA